jgi:hypothetical protein
MIQVRTHKRKGRIVRSHARKTSATKYHKGVAETAQERWDRMNPGFVDSPEPTKKKKAKGGYTNVEGMSNTKIVRNSKKKNC